MIRRLAAAFVRWTQAFSIRVKIMGLAVGAVALMTAWAGVLIHTSISRTVGTELELRGLAIARDVATRSTELVLTGSSVALHELLRSTRASHSDVRYVAVLDARGRPLAHTFPTGFPADLLNLPSPAPGDDFHLELLETSAEWIRDLAVPIMGGAAGTVRVGMSEARMRSAVGITTLFLVLAFLAAACLGILAAYMLTRILTRPVLDLVDATRVVAAGNLAHRAPPGPPDEIGLLVTAFNDMVARVATSQRVREELLERVITAQEEERRRIARELHDETSQAVTSLLVGLRALESAEDLAQVRERSTAMRLLAGRTLTDLHRLVLELRPRVLDELGLIPAVRRYAADFSATFGLPVDLQTVGREDARLPAPVEICLYRVIQEAMTNIARHAEASRVSLVVDVEPRRVTVVLEDDGKGFDPDGALARHGEDYSLGLHGMRERAALVGGELVIESTPGSGSAVFVRVPL